jgi:hypothetical protein
MAITPAIAHIPGIAITNPSITFLSLGNAEIKRRVRKARAALKALNVSWEGTRAIPMTQRSKIDQGFLKKSRRYAKKRKITPTVVKDSILAIGVTKVYHHGFDN